MTSHCWKLAEGIGILIEKKNNKFYKYNVGELSMLTESGSRLPTDIE